MKVFLRASDLPQTPIREKSHRLTGDPHREELIAPLWALEKETYLKAIRNALTERELWQGKLFRNK